jgi:hypothetical protein
MTDDFAQFDLALGLRDAESRKPWPSGLYSKTLVKKDDLRVVLFVMELGAGGPAASSIVLLKIGTYIRTRVDKVISTFAPPSTLPLGESLLCDSSPARFANSNDTGSGAVGVDHRSRTDRIASRSLPAGSGLPAFARHATNPSGRTNTAPCGIKP